MLCDKAKKRIFLDDTMNVCEHASFKDYIVKWKQYLRQQNEKNAYIQITMEHDVQKDEWILTEIIKILGKYDLYADGSKYGDHMHLLLVDVYRFASCCEKTENQYHRMTKLDFFNYLEFEEQCIICDHSKNAQPIIETMPLGESRGFYLEGGQTLSKNLKSPLSSKVGWRIYLRR